MKWSITTLRMANNLTSPTQPYGTKSYMTFRRGNIWPVSAVPTALHTPNSIPFRLDHLCSWGIQCKERYGLEMYANGKPSSIADKEKVRVHTLVSVGIAEALDLFATRNLPFIFETPAIHEGQVSMGHIDEFRASLQLPGVNHKIGMQCPFGALSSKPMAWIYLVVEFDVTNLDTSCVTGSSIKMVRRS